MKPENSDRLVRGVRDVVVVVLGDVGRKQGKKAFDWIRKKVKEKVLKK